MKLQFRLTFKQGTSTVGEVTGLRDGLRDRIEAGGLTIEDLVEHVEETERFLERLTGLRVRIEQVG